MPTVAETAPLRVQLIAKTEFVAPPDIAWSTDADGGQALTEFAGRACYQSWSKPNPKTATCSASSGSSSLISVKRASYHAIKFRSIRRSLV